MDWSWCYEGGVDGAGIGGRKRDRTTEVFTARLSVERGQGWDRVNGKCQALVGEVSIAISVIPTVSLAPPLDMGVTPSTRTALITLIQRAGLH